MKKVLKTLATILGWIILFVAFASLGFFTDEPEIGVPIYFIFFLIVFGLVFLYTKKRHKKQQVNPKIINLLQKIFGAILVLLALFSPSIVFGKANFPFFSYFLITVITTVLIAIGTIAISIIHNSKEKSAVSILLGYLLLIVISAIPAIGVLQSNAILDVFSNAYSALGFAYWASLSVAVFSWWGISLFFKKE